MKELKESVMTIIDRVNQDWVDTLKEAEEKNTGVDLSKIMGLYSKNITLLDKKFNEAEQRVKGRKGWFK